MSERILKALMQLFAIIARTDGSDGGRDVVRSFLKQQLNQEMVNHYLKIFEEFLESHHKSSKRKDGSAKRTSLNSVKVLKICTQINEELTQKQKVVVLIRLIEFVHSNEEVNEQEMEFITTVSETFNIENKEFNRCLHFVKNKENEIPDSSKILIIDKNNDTNLSEVKHIRSEGLEGQIRVLYIPSINMYVLRYYGTSDLYLNGQVIMKDKVYILTQGSSIRSSKVTPIYYSDIISSFLRDTTQDKINFVAKDVTYKFKGGNIGLHTININEESGRLIGIMGGSGAGKSTLLNVLNSNEKPTSGEILINGINIHQEADKIEGVIGHVSQDDLLIEELTVFQNLFYNAKLCFGNLSDNEITKRVLDMLTSIGLYEARNIEVGSPLNKKISGGQRKRLNIALELIREPSVLFVDEPTSGLSSRDSENIMDLLKELALKGKLVFVVIHQPSSDIFKMFDMLMILDVGGYPIYYGNPVDAVIYFKKMINHVNADESECPTCGNVNPEQIFNIIESKVLDEYGNQTLNRKIAPSEWNEHYLEQLAGNHKSNVTSSDVPTSTFKIPNKIKQFKVFITRDVLSKLTNKQYLAINLLEAPLLSFILAYLVKFYNTDISNTTGYIFRENDNIPAFLFMSVVVALFIGLTVSAEEIIRDQKILKRESFLNLSKGSYLVSKIFIMFILSAIQTFTFVLIGNLVLEIQDMGFAYWMVLFTASCFANMLGLNISASFNSAVTIYILIPFLIIPQLLLSGVIVKFDKLNPTITSQSIVPFAGEIMTSRWAFEALAVNQFKNNEYNREFYKYDKAMSKADFKKNFWIPKLRSKLDKCENNLKSDDPIKQQEIVQDIQLVKSELAKEIAGFNRNIPLEMPTELNANNVNPKAIKATKDFLQKLNKYYIKLYNKASREKDKIIGAMNKTPEEKETFLKKKNEYVNESLSDLVTNRTELDKIIELNGQFVQRADPVYLDPTISNFGRAHFFAPRKQLFGNYYDTYWVNLGVIWLMSVTLMITLYFDVLKKFINSFEIIASKFSKE